MNDDADLQPGMVIDADDLDAKLIKVVMRGSPQFTGAELQAIAEHFGKDMTEFSVAEMQLASGWVYLRRATGKEVSWETVAERVTVTIDERLDPTGPPSSAT